MNPKTNTDITPWPSSVLEAAHLLIQQLPHEDIIAISKMSIEEVAFLNLSLGTYIRNEFGLWEGNVVLMESCADEADKESLHQDEASAVIIAKLALELRKTNGIFY
ncbi:MAG: hypothetical protein KQI78_12250 [Deltaproteobacteria bacterium]|nr:hypothetical protein [Deltaproteobacteria bacterium]